MPAYAVAAEGQQLECGECWRPFAAEAGRPYFWHGDKRLSLCDRCIDGIAKKATGRDFQDPTPFTDSDQTAMNAEARKAATARAAADEKAGRWNR